MRWQPIDNTLVPSRDPAYACQNRANRYTVSFPATLGSPIRSESAGQWVEFSLVGGSSQGSVSGATDSFTVPGAELRYTAGNDVLQEQIILAGPSSPATFVFALHTSPGLTPRQAPDGRIEFVDAAGTVPFAFAPPSMQDSSHTPGGFSRAVSLSLAQTAAGTTVTLSADRSWLSAPGRQFPVVIDPQVAYNTNSVTGAQDCLLASGPYATDTYCGAGNLDVGYNSSWTGRSLLQFNLQGVLPANSTVLEAQLGLELYSEANTTSLAISAYQLTRSWTTAATWNTDDGTTPWTTPGGDFAATAAATNSSVGGTTGWAYWYPTQLVQGWVNGSIPNDGLLLKEPTENVTNTLYFYSSEAASSSDWPYLQIDYAPLLGAQSFYTMAGQALDDQESLAVNLANGNLVATASDFSMPGIDLPVGFSRTYNSLQAGIWNDMGNGWVTGTGGDITLAFLDDGSIMLQGPGGSQVLFLLANGSYTSPPGMDATLLQTGSGYTLTDHASGEVLTFDQAGFLLSDADRLGNKLSDSYNPQPSQTLASITDTQGRTTSFSYGSINAGGSGLLITQVTDPAGRTYQYGYDASDDLVSYTNPAGGVTQYAYDSNFRLDQITTPAGHVTTIGYDSSGRVSSMTAVTNTATGAGDTTTFTYNTGSTVVTDANGHATTYALDNQGRATGVTYPDGTTSHASWTADNQVASTQTPSGATTSFTYDALNNLTRVSLPTGATVSATYNNASFPYLPDSTTDAQGNTTTYQYTSSGLLSQVTDPSGKYSTSSYNTNGTLASETDENGHTTSHTYNTSGTSVGLPLQDTPPAPKGTTSYTFTSANQEATVTTGTGKQTGFVYDALGRVTGISYGDGSSIGYAYDGDGNLLAMTDSTGTTTYSYDALDQLTKETLPSNQTITYSYDAVGNLLSKTDSGGTIAYGYNQDDELTSATDRQGKTYTLGYDQDGNRTSLAFPNGVTEQMSYNSGGQLTRIWASTASGTLTSFSYSYTNPTTNQVTGLPYSVTDGSGNTTSYTYDNGNELTAATQKNSGGAQTASYGYGYDPAGNLTSKTVNGTSTSFAYNAADELTGASGGMSMSYTYDANGDRTGSSDGTRINLNAAGQITSITPPNSTAIPMTYTGVGEQQRIGSGSTKYQYDGTGLAKQTDSLGDTYFTCLPDGELLAETIPSGTSAGTYYYLSDGAGSVAALTDSTGAIKDSYSYDPLGNTTSTGSVPNPFTFQGGMYDSSTHLYYSGGGYYDPATGQSFGCQDQGWVDPGEDLCGEDESDPSGLGPGGSVSFRGNTQIPGVACILAGPLWGALCCVYIAHCSLGGGPERTQWGWRGGPRWRQAVAQVRNGGIIRQVLGKVPTKQEGLWLIEDAGGTADRIEPGHLPPNPIDFCHINYHVDRTRGHLAIQDC